VLRFLKHTHIHTHGRTPLDEWSAHRSCIYLHRTTHKHKRKDINTLSGIRTHDPNNQAAALDHAANTIDIYVITLPFHKHKIWYAHRSETMLKMLGNVLSPVKNCRYNYREKCYVWLTFACIPVPVGKTYIQRNSTQKYHWCLSYHTTVNGNSRILTCSNL
jgi:hypothetical protein